MAKTSLNPFRLLSDAWAFLRSQPALYSVLLWFLMVPVVLMDILEEYWPHGDTEQLEQISMVAFGFAQLVLTVVLFWGLACALLVGRRMVLSRAGRARTSFRSVRRESIKLIVPLFFTSVLRAVITLEWALLAIIPAILFVMASPLCREVPTIVLNGIQTITIIDVSHLILVRCQPLLLMPLLLIPAGIYQLRTVFFGIVIASENLRYRDALRRSKAMVRGKFWVVLGVTAVLCFVIFAPAALLSIGVDLLQPQVVPDVPVLSGIVNDVVFSFAGLLFTLSLVAFYGKLRKAAGRVEEVVPELE
jgi:uncharacterized membrane protein